jgi:hypothetical protein
MRAQPSLAARFEAAAEPGDIEVLLTAAILSVVGVAIMVLIDAAPEILSLIRGGF